MSHRTMWNIVAALILVSFTVAGCGADGEEPGKPPPATVDGAPSVWVIDEEEPPTREAQSFTALVSRLECSGGVTGTVLEPIVAPGADQVVVTFAVEPLSGSAYTCQGNDQVPYIVELGEPIGDRELIDGACLAGDAIGTSYCTQKDAGIRWEP